MSVKNISKVYLLSVPLENDYKNTLYFGDKASQQSYFASKVVKSYMDFNYQRKDQKIKVSECYDDIYMCNYVMYQNSAYSNKWFYCFIKDMTFISDSVTEITIETDVIQTWMFDYTVKPSFVEREHVSDDSVGLHTYPEGLETGEFVVNSVVSSNIGTGHVVIASTWDPFEEKEAGSFINGLYQGVDYFLINQESSTAAISYFLSAMEKQGKIEAVTGMFIAPDTLTNYNNLTWKFMSEGDLSYYKYAKLNSTLGSGATTLGDIVIQKELNNINGYVPKNKKLFTFPYQYINCSNNNGGNVIYKYEYFSANPFSIKMKGVISPGCSIRAYPRLYKGTDDNYDEGINVGKFPICSYNTDMYTNWLTQNGLNIALNVASGIGQIAGGIGIGLASGGLGLAIGGGSIAGGVGTIASTLAQVHQQSFTPPQAEGNLNCGDVTYSMGINELTFYKMSIKNETARKIDSFFSMFGYKICETKIPNKNHRSRYWYTKTIDVNIDGNIPNNDMQIIKNCYNNGITFWRNASEIQNYDLSNGTI